MARQPPKKQLCIDACLVELMAYVDESRYNVRQLDDETQTYLVDFFKQASTEPDFRDLYQGLTDDEREKLHQMEKTLIQ